MEPIYFNSREEPFGHFSNFAYSPIVVAGYGFATVEHWYQANKAQTPEDFERIRTVSTPERAKALGHSINKRSDWDHVRLQVMYRGLFAKFTQHPALAHLLLATGERPLHEESDDAYWGLAAGVGEDWLGRLLGTVRYQLQFKTVAINDRELYGAIGSTATSGFIMAGLLREASSPTGCWCIHLIKQRTGGPAAANTLQRILNNAVLEASAGADYDARVSFSVGTLEGARSRVFGSDRAFRVAEDIPPYSGLGVALPFMYMRELSLRPAIHVAPQDRAQLSHRERFRAVSYSPGHHFDWAYESEWMSPEAVRLRPDLALILVPDRGTASKLSMLRDTDWAQYDLESLQWLKPGPHSQDAGMASVCPPQLQWIASYRSCLAETPPFRFESTGSAKARRECGPRTYG